MEGAIFLIAILLLAVIITPIVIAASSNSKINRLSDELNAIKQYLKSIKQEVEKLSVNPPVTPYTPPEKSIYERPPSIVPEPAIQPEVIAEQAPEPIPELAPNETTEPKEEQPAENIPPAIIEEAPTENIPAAIETNVPEEELALAEEAVVYANTTKPFSPEINRPQAPPLTPYTPPPPRKKTDFEQFIGEKLISIVGIAILVLGIFFSVKWAIDRHLISDAGKVMIGLVSGTILIAVAHRLAKNYRAFSSILVGGGIAVFYFSIYEAYQTYHLLSQTAAFVVMILITLLAVILSIIYNKKELAIIAIVGGFCTPFFVSDGSGNYQVLFSYLLILNIGMFVLAYFKKWNLVNIICYAFTMILFAGWVGNSFDETKGHAGGGLLFLSLFFVTFFGMNIIYNLRNRTKFGITEISMLLSNSFIYLGFGLYFLSYIQNGKYQGMFTLALAIFNFIFAYTFYKRQQVDKNLVFLLIGLVLTFLSLTGPLQLDGNFITLFWAAEVVILFWMGMKTGIPLLKNASILVLALTVISLGMDWEHDYFQPQINKMMLVFNKAFITSAVVVLSILVKRRLLQKDKDESLLWGTLPKRYYITGTGALLTGLIYLAGLFEVQYQSFAITQNYHYQVMMMWIYQYFILAIMAWYFNKTKEPMHQRILMCCIALFLLLYPAANYSVSLLRDQPLHSNLYHWHYLMPLLALACIVFLIRYVRKNYNQEHNIFKAMAWGATAVIVFILSAEAVQIWTASAQQPGFASYEIVERARKVAMPIIWSICSLSLMLLGMRRKMKIFRIISLSLFSLTIAKLFLYDISNVGQGGKIAAFIILGIILLVVSFMYQKIKGLFTDEESKQPDQNSANPQ
jgi:uncharacterized membrane protein